MVAAVDRLALEVFKRVVHPAHVPLQAEAETTEVDRSRDARPGRRLLGDRLHVGVVGVHTDVQLLQEVDRLEIFVAAVSIGAPLPGFA